MFKIGYRTMKTALGATLAIMIAQFFGLDNFASAGILTILCVQVTKKKSLKAAWSRFLACLLAIVFSAILFEAIAYHPIVIGLMLLLFIPTTVTLKIQEGIVTSSVIVLHFYMAGNLTVDLVLNETALIIIGIGVALIMNLYMPSLENKLVTYRVEIEKNFSVILREIVNYLRTNESDWDGKEITETNQLLEEAKTMAFRDVENHFLRGEDVYYHYFKMREKQFEIIERILPLVTSIPTNVRQSGILADFIQELSENVHPQNTAIVYLQQLEEMRGKIKEMELPKTREDFESRAALFQLVREMERYLEIKLSFKGLPLETKGRMKNDSLV
ncbi:aromatic acid exporter family protein [Bacillus sp. V59.32b]|uniref:aromatic acid exporter family protein n=1 Tax=Bacillus sp. V59.32b TaxID=1758642 RepID=UPI000E3E7096|nr:aromatic acid exporter family protein [Bacillus sp. V59.32b]RFU69210.1 aromatic acid exporter family protein [Bacillus sp. V59.32b]